MTTRVPLWRLGLAFSAGVMAGALLPALPAWSILGLLLAISAAAAICPRLRLPAVLVLGVVWFAGHAQWHLDRSWPADRSGEQVELTGRIVGLPETRGHRTRVVVISDRAARAGGIPRRLVLTWHRPLEYFQPGERWVLQARLDPPVGRLNQGAFDYTRFLLARRIGATGQISQATPAQAAGFSGITGRARQRTAEWLQATTVNLEAAALHRALAVADRAAMDPEFSGVLRRTGTAHLLAISGLHVGMVAALSALAVGVLLTPMLGLCPGLDRRRVAMLAGVCGALGYAALAGFTLPTQRALVMLMVVAGAIVLRRHLQPGYAVVLALVAVLLTDPLAPLDIGFWLSFGAVIVLVWAFAWRPGRAGWASGLVRAQLLLAIGLLPLNVGVFQQLVPIALVANLLAIPVIGLWVLPLTLSALALFLAGLPLDGLVRTSELGLVAVIRVLDWLDGLDFGHFYISPAPAWAAGLAMVGALWLLAPRGWPIRVAGLLLLVPLFASAPTKPEPGEFKAWITDMGDGLAVLVQTHNEILLYDTGPGDGDGQDRIESVIVPLLRSLGEVRIDRLIVSHARLAHAGGMSSAMSRLRPTHVRGSGLDGIEPCTASEHWQVDQVRFRMLHPSAALPSLGPDSSCVLEIRGAGGSLLLTGGISAVVTRRLLNQGLAEPVDALVLPRAGHRQGFEPAWLEQLSPEWVIASVAASNRRGLPHPGPRQVAARAGARFVTTGQCGALEIESRRGSGLTLRSQRGSARRFWLRQSSCPGG